MSPMNPSATRQPQRLAAAPRADQARQHPPNNT